MSLEDPGSVSFAGIGGLGEQVRELREVIELPLMNPELFEVGLRIHAQARSRCAVLRVGLARKRADLCRGSVSSRPRVSCCTVPPEQVSVSRLILDISHV
jgi:hypothetical protein